VQVWKGARPALPDGLPLDRRRAAWPAMWLNLGHGDGGWALACGSARVPLADLIARPRGRDRHRTAWGIERA
jgi:D-amino-acid dehydrogenase